MGHDDGKRGEILAAAGMVFGQYGIRKTTMGDILQAAGVARATLYKYFPSKEDVFAAVLRRELEDILECMEQAVADAETTRGKLRAAIVTHTRMVRQKVNTYRVTMKLLAEIMPLPNEHASTMAAELQRIFARILEDGVEAGEIAVKDIELTSLTLVYALKGIFMGAAIEMWTENRDEIVDSLLDLLMDGMRPREEPA
ncbi:TetR/AcrR family transcriptional regulator [bacterium]|nr:TetR/AcrR family transcriptional regulator [bacterium]